jgi:hypothetical protein
MRRVAGSPFQKIALGAGARRRALRDDPSAGPNQGASPHRHGASNPFASAGRAGGHNDMR